MEVQQIFEAWRCVNRSVNHWGLAWFIAHEICRRYYASHGIVPYVIEHENLGYYGIQFDRLPCPVHGGKALPSLGRMTILGDVENWRTGNPGDHGLHLIGDCAQGMPTSELVQRSIEHLGLTPYPEKSHLGCRHQRWGASYVFCFGIAAIVAMRQAEMGNIWNHTYQTEVFLRNKDPKYNIPEHPGVFCFRSISGREMLLIGDGRLITENGIEDWWARYMHGESCDGLARELETRLHS